MGGGAFTDAFIHSLRENHFNVNIMKLYSDIYVYVKNGGYEQIPNLSSTTPNPNYTFTRANAGVLKTTNIPIIMDVTPTPTTTPRPTVTTLKVSPPTVTETVVKKSVPTNDINILKNVYRKKTGGFGKMF